MIHSVTLTNYLGESVTLELRFPEKSGFLVREITGLEPPKADINTTEILTSDGSFFNSARLNSRNIVLVLVLLENPTIELSRLNTYKYFPVKQLVTLIFQTDNRLCRITGYVESNEPSIFTEQQETTISIVCPYPYFYEVNDQSSIFSGIDSLFEFPFWNDSLSSNLLVFGTLSQNMNSSIYYSGDAPIGIRIYIHALGSVSNPRIINLENREIMKINTNFLTALTGQGIIEGDNIIISTVIGSKYVHLERNGVVYNILSCLEKGASWFQLERGINNFMYLADSGVQNLEFRIENSVIYEGL